MKWFLRAANMVFYAVVILLLAASLGSILMKQPFLMTVIRSNSMYPLLERGDLVFLERIRLSSNIQVGDIALFKAAEGSLSSKGWIMHRIIDGSEDTGYVTKGDNSDLTDQDGGSARIRRDWVAGRAIQVGRAPIRIRLLGYVPLWAEEFSKNKLFLPMFTCATGVLIAIVEFLPGRKKARASQLEVPALFMVGGIFLTVVLAASMLSTSSNLTIVYEVTESSEGSMMGSSIGVMRLGQEIERPLSSITNKSFFPVIATVSSNDPQINFSRDVVTLFNRQGVDITYRVTGNQIGQYRSTVWVGMLLPLLPPVVVRELAQKSFWLALFAVALVPGLPVMIYPLWVPKYRRRFKTAMRRSFSRLF